MIIHNSVLITDNILLPDGLPGHPLALVARLLAGEVLQVLGLQQLLLYAARHLAGQHRDALSRGESYNCQIVREQHPQHQKMLLFKDKIIKIYDEPNNEFKVGQTTVLSRVKTSETGISMK